MELTVRHGGDQVVITIRVGRCTETHLGLVVDCACVDLVLHVSVARGALTSTVLSTRASDVEAGSASRFRASSLAPSPESSLGARVGAQKVRAPADAMDNHGPLIDCCFWDDLGCILSHQERNDLGTSRGNGL